MTARELVIKVVVTCSPSLSHPEVESFCHSNEPCSVRQAPGGVASHA